VATSIIPQAEADVRQRWAVADLRQWLNMGWYRLSTGLDDPFFIFNRFL